MTRDQAGEFLIARGVTAREAEKVLGKAQRFPCRWAYTANRWAAAVYTMPGGTWDACDCRETEVRIAALRTARSRGWRLVL